MTQRHVWRTQRPTLAALAFLVVVGYFAMPTSDARLAAFLGGNALVVVAAVVGLRRLPQGQRRTWGLFAGAMSMYLVANAGQISGQIGLTRPVPFPSWTDGLFLAAYLLLGAGIFLVRPGVKAKRRMGNWGALADALMIGGGMAVASWKFLIEPQLTASSTSDLARAVSVAYPVLDLVLFVAAAQLALRRSTRSPALTLLGGFTLFLLAGDVVYGRAQLSGSFHPGGLSEGLWLTSFLCLALLGLDRGLATLSESSDAEELEPGWRRQLLMNASALVAPLFMLTQVRASQRLDLVFYGVVSALLFTLAIARIGSYSRRLAHEARHDHLTGLPNRALLLRRLRDLLERTPGDEANPAILFVDLDGFKLVNDSLGHDVGDELLVAAAGRLTGAVRGQDLVGRLGGDEFVIICGEGTSQGDAQTIACRIGKALSSPFRIDGREIQLTASIGITATDGVRSADELLGNADAAMYEAKRRGRARWATFDEDMRRRLIERVELQAELRRALDQEELFLQYQPIVDLSSTSLLGFEALVRWRHPERGVLMPASFIPAAEESGLIVSIGQWVMAESCRQLARWHRSYPDLSRLSVGVNVSARQLDDPGLVDMVRTVLQDTALDPSCLVLEITESGLLDDSDSVVARLGALRSFGIRIALDDFGTGYSCLRHLADVPVDIVKIDRSFVRESAAAGAPRGLMAESIAVLARTLGLDCIAEGIETPAEVLRLRQAGCPAGQGFLFARPLDQAQALGWIERAAMGQACVLDPATIGRGQHTETAPITISAA